MNLETFFANIDSDHPAYLLLTRSDGQMETFALEDNNSFFAGSGASCRIAIEGPEVQAIHCMFWLSETGELCAQDWNTHGKTILNGTPIESEVELKTDDELKIGANVIVPVLTRECHVRVVRGLADQFDVPEDSAVDQAEPIGEEAETETAESTKEWTDTECPLDVASTPAPIAALPVGPSFADSSFEYQLDSDADDGFPNDSADHGLADTSSLFGSADGFEAQGFAGASDDGDDVSDEVAMLQMEIDQLRFELSERDARLRTSDDTRKATSPPNDDDDQTIRLVNRLEELLTELQQSDDRTRELEELLRVSDQATQAEQEERQQLESWVTEIEQRVCQREEETQAEMGRLVDRLNQAHAQRDHAASQLTQVLESKSSDFDEPSQDIIHDFRRQIEDLQKRMEELNDENAQLRQPSRSDSGEVVAAEDLKKMEQKLLDAQVAASQERAEMARQRAELQRLKDELDCKLKSSSDSGLADSRLQAMRQHLREIHEQEQLEMVEKKQKSLGGRISRLLNRVGR